MFPGDLRHVLGLRDLGTIYNNGGVLREESIDRVLQVSLRLCLCNRGDMVLDPLGEGWQDDSGRHFIEVG